MIQSADVQFLSNIFHQRLVLTPLFFFRIIPPPPSTLATLSTGQWRVVIISRCRSTSSLLPFCILTEETKALVVTLSPLFFVFFPQHICLGRSSKRGLELNGMQKRNAFPILHWVCVFFFVQQGLYCSFVIHTVLCEFS